MDKLDEKALLAAARLRHDRMWGNAGPGKEAAWLHMKAPLIDGLRSDISAYLAATPAPLGDVAELVERVLKHRREVSVVLVENLTPAEQQRAVANACASMAEAATSLTSLQAELVEARKILYQVSGQIDDLSWSVNRDCDHILKPIEQFLSEK